MVMANLKRRVEELERQLATRPSYSIQFDEDALAIYNSMSYLDATVAPTYKDVEPTPIYARGTELRDARYGPIVPAHLDGHIKRYTRASGEFELAFGREPKAADMLWYEDVLLMHSTENYARQLGRMIEARQRQFPQLTCPLKFEEGRLFRRLTPERRGAEPKWEEDIRIQPDVRWLKIPEVNANTDFETMRTIPALVFLGVADVKHRCRPATEEDLPVAEKESPIKEPTGFMLGNQRLCELLVEVFGA
jgi:hypothetical protein